jgi:hypothetical protein
VTIGTLSRLTRALDRAARAHAIRRGMGIYLTEFGVQSRPDPFIGVSFTAQAEFRSMSERIAYRNARVRAFSQYLMTDDQPRAGPASQRYSGFESGLRTSSGRAKASYDGFRLPLVAHRGRRRVTLWGLVRPHRGRATVSIDYRSRRGHAWHLLKHDRTEGRGYWSTTTRYRADRRYRVRWRDPGGVWRAGPTTRVYSRG